MNLFAPENCLIHHFFSGSSSPSPVKLVSADRFLFRRFGTTKLGVKGIGVGCMVVESHGWFFVLEVSVYNWVEMLCHWLMEYEGFEIVVQFFHLEHMSCEEWKLFAKTFRFSLMLSLWLTIFSNGKFLLSMKILLAVTCWGKTFTKKKKTKEQYLGWSWRLKKKTFYDTTYRMYFWEAFEKSINFVGSGNGHEQTIFCWNDLIR